MFISQKCQICITDKSRCDDCKDNPKYRNIPRQSLFMAYEPACPFGMMDCISDPAYDKFYYPDYYKELYGDKTVEEALNDSCSSCLKYDYPKYYDDEDK